jgi:hypothetical protein
MILYQYRPFAKKKMEEIEACVEIPGCPDILTIDHGTFSSSATLETFLKDGEYALTPRQAIEARIAIQERIIQKEQETLEIVKKDLEKCPE